MRLGWRPGNEIGVEAWERGWCGGLGMRLGWRPGNEARKARQSRLQPWLAEHLSYHDM